MLTINLEKSLMKANKKIYSPSELLIVKEYDRLSELRDDTTLERIGMKSNIRQGEHLKSKNFSNKTQTERFNQERVFHISQIKNICNKYHLRFLPANLFNGSIDASLPAKINTFEIAYDVRVGHDSSFIVAPASSFELEEKPKDPLFFYKINNSYYYLIHKWGNDLNIIRMVLPMLSNVWIARFLVFIPIFLITYKSLAGKNNNLETIPLVGFILAVSGVIYLLFGLFMALIIDDEDVILFIKNGFIKKNEWDSPIK